MPVARKMNAVLDPPVIDGEIVQPTITPPPGTAPKKRGRPSNAERAARPRAEQAPPAPALDPKDTIILAAMVLRGIGMAARADAPTDEEIALVNGPLCMVANKYNFGGKFVPELMLAGTLLMAVSAMKQRRVAKLVEANAAAPTSVPLGDVVNLNAGTVNDAAGNSDRPRTQRVGENAIDPAVSSLADALARD